MLLKRPRPGEKYVNMIHFWR